MGNEHLQLGQKGEQYAADFLTQNGYTLVEKNWKTPFAEIDIIARHQGFLCFIEVKTRTSQRKGLPREAVTFTKQQKIVAGASYYLKQSGQPDQRVRFDVLEVFVNLSGDAKQPLQCTLIPGAFQAYER